MTPSMDRSGIVKKDLIVTLVLYMVASDALKAWLKLKGVANK